ncbi:MAG: hypothetical protein HKO82_12830 [Acidimicrobiia bacterium]|nr:hypothetical protein [Acidimicrobiia bacterium]RZV47155.1 MAG: hypothetical protein EX267_01830 [Acidimicrobiia bacterium]
MTINHDESPQERSPSSRAARAGLRLAKWLGLRVLATVRWAAGAVRKSGSLAISRFKEWRAAPKDAD